MTQSKMKSRVAENGKVDAPTRMIALTINADGTAAIQHPGVGAFEVATILRKAAMEWEKKLGARE